MLKKNLVGVILAFVFALVLAACDNGSTTEPSDKDTALDGTWVSGTQEITLKDGKFEASDGGTLIAQGEYTIVTEGKLTMKVTHIHGGALVAEEPLLATVISSKWYTKDELKTRYKQIESFLPSTVDKDQIDQYLNEAFSEQTAAYTLNGDTLTLSSNGQTETYTRKK